MRDQFRTMENGIFSRISAITLIDCRFRFRRTAGMILMLAIAGGVYLIMPDFRTGVTLMQIGNHRVIYNSAAVALGTSMFCSVLLPMTGFYLVSNAIRRDIVTRTGLIIASTPVGNAEYVVGKFLGSSVYLTSVMLVCMVSSMVMFLIRGEGALEPLTFLSIYLWMTLPAIVFCAAMGILFESVPMLSGRIGDVIYFLISTGFLAVPAILMEQKPSPDWARLIDLAGISTIVGQVTSQFNTTAVSIGQSDFDPNVSAILYPGLAWGSGMVLERVATIFLPLLLLVVARFSFHRFNPTRLKASGRQSHRNPVTWLNAKLKKMTRFLLPLGRAGVASRSLAGAVRADIVTTLLLSPLTLLALMVFAIVSLSMDVKDLREGVLPAIIAVAVIAVADIVARDDVSGLSGLLYTTPRIKHLYVYWKFTSSLVLTAGFTIIPVIRLMQQPGSSAVSLLIGTCLIASTSVGFGLMTRGRKAFMGALLMLLYITLNARTEAGFDFAGFNGCATRFVQACYAGTSTAVLILAQAIHASRLRKA